MSDTDAAVAFPATLDLSSADTRGNLMENGWKDAVVFEVKPVATNNPGGNLPLGTPGVSVQFQIEGGKYNNRRIWTNYWFPPTGYDTEKRDRMLGMWARFLKGVGYTDEQIKSKDFDIAACIAKLNTEKPTCQVNTKYDEDFDNNKVQGVKERGASNAGTGAGVL